MQRVFHIATIANNLSMYQAMRASMDAAGFDEARCRFTLFDNSESNRYEPYEVLRQLAGDGSEPYILLCHQDLLFKPESTAHMLEEQLRNLQKIDPTWAVAGNAGVDSHWRLQACLDEPAGSHRSSPLPAAVVSLDENLLVLRRSHYVLPSPGLTGFHLYATDLCLNAYMQRKSTYVIEFLVQHLSQGNAQSADFLEARARLIEAWRSRLLLGFILTPCAMVQVAEARWLIALLRSGKVRNFLRNTGICRIARLGARDSRTNPSRVS